MKTYDIVKFIKQKRELLSYLFWGLLTTIVSWGSYTLCVWFLNNFQLLEMVTVAVSNIFSWICATIFSFVTNKLFVFKSNCWKKSVFIPEAVKFITTRLATGALELVMVPALVLAGLNQTLFGVQGMLSKMGVSIFIVILNYIFSKIFIFKKTSNKTTTACK